MDTPDSVPIGGAIVSLSDKTQRLLDQTASDPDGKYPFSGLPPGFYWVTARRHGDTQDTGVLRHVELTSSAPSVNRHLVIILEESTNPSICFASRYSFVLPITPGLRWTRWPGFTYPMGILLIT